MTCRLAATLLMVAASACSEAPAAQGARESYERGAAALAAGQPRTARVELMNAIKAAPNDPAPRVLQARTYLKLGDGVAAAAEIQRARQLGVPAGRTRHLLAEAFLLQGDARRAIDEAAMAPAAFAAPAALVRGRALVALADMKGAAAAFEDALAAAPRDPESWLEAARFRRSDGNLAGAIAAADRALALAPRNVEALTLRGELTRRQYGLSASIPWFDKALESDPENVVALLERAATFGEMGRARAMLADTRKALSLTGSKQPVAYHLQALLAARGGDFALARALHQKTGGALDDKPAGMLLAAAIDYQSGNAGQAVRRLEKLVAIQPGNAKARRLLAAAYWKRGDTDGTIAALRPLAERPDADSYTLSLMGKALAAQRDAAGAASYLVRAALPQQRASAALLAAPVDDAQLAAMRGGADANPADVARQVALIAALLSRGLGDEALARARQLQAANPGAPDAHVLVGDALSFQGDHRSAAEEYRKAANLAFSESVAMRMIEALERSGQAAAAAQVLQLFLQQNPSNVNAQLLAATRFMQARQYDRAIVLYEGLRMRLGNRDAGMLNNLAWAYFEKGDYERAIPLARKAWSLDRHNPATGDTLGWLLFNSGENRALGLALLSRASQGAPSDAQIRAQLERKHKT